VIWAESIGRSFGFRRSLWRGLPMNLCLSHDE
jgi:hypothetical protein